MPTICLNNRSNTEGFEQFIGRGAPRVRNTHTHVGQIMVRHVMIYAEAEDIFSAANVAGRERYDRKVCTPIGYQDLNFTPHWDACYDRRSSTLRAEMVPE